MESAFTRALTVLKFDVHLFQNSMASGSPSHIEIPKYVFVIPPNILETLFGAQHPLPSLFYTF
jgi:hypothetical protein